MSTPDLAMITIRGRNAFDRRIERATSKPLRGAGIETIQVNIGLRCNLACHHCHVESSPKRTEEMDWETMQQVLAAADRAGATTLDITGGAPEMHPCFRPFVSAALRQDLHVIVRTNLTILLQAGYEDLPHWLARNHVHLIASLPCYLETNVDRQRGRHVYRDSIEAIRRLNSVGYGHHCEPPLDLVYNPGGPSLPPAQGPLEAAYRRELAGQFGIHFTRLFTITNMAIGRFLHDLRREGRMEQYLQLLREAFNPATIDSLMCRQQIHIGWDGTLYDCDFNYALSLPINGPIRHLRDFDPNQLARRSIATGEHCFGCTAGCGSSCGGALVST